MEDYRLTQSGQEVQNILDGAAMQVDLTAETERATDAEQTLQGNIDAEETRAEGAEGTLQDNIDAEEARAKAAEKQNADDIDAIEEKIPSGASSSNKLATEEYVADAVATATATFRGTYNLVSDLHLNVTATEQQIAASLAGAISTADNNDYCFILVPTSSETPTEIKEIDRYKFNGTAWAFEYKLNNSGFTAAQWAAINSGITSGDVAKLAALPTNAQLTTLLAGLQSDIDGEEARAKGAEGTLQDNIDAEEARAKAAEKQNADDIDAIEDVLPETASSENKVATESEINSLSAAIEAILLLIPSAATSLNKLADKAFVNSSIATATATFRGTYNLVDDLGLTTSATHAQIATALAGSILTADNNDYAFVQIPTSDAMPTEIAKTERYKFNGTSWEYEYDLNNSGFTADQWAAINSGITQALVTKLAALPTNAQLTTELGTLTSGITTINQKIPSAASQANKLVDTAAMEVYIVQVLDVLTISYNVTSTDGHVTLSIEQVDGKVTSVTLTTSDIASAAALNLKASQADLTALASRVTTAEGNITTLGGRVSTNETDIAQLQAAYEALTQSEPVIIQPTDTWPVANPSTDVIYRVIDRVNTPPEYYSDYMWNGTTMVLMATYDNAIDDEPTPGSNNLVKSGGVLNSIIQNGPAFDLSAYNAVGGVLATYANLSAALTALNALDAAYKQPGMSFKFVHSVDNKYVQYRLMSDTFNTTPANWQGVDDEPTAGSDNLVKSGGVYKKTLSETLRIDSRFNVNSVVTSSSVGLWQIRFPDVDSVIGHSDYMTLNLAAHSTAGSQPFHGIWITDLYAPYNGKTVCVEFDIKGTTQASTSNKALAISGEVAQQFGYTTEWEHKEIYVNVTSSRIFLFNASANDVEFDIKNMSVKADTSEVVDNNFYADYKFKGVARKENDPDVTPGEKSFYITGEAGTYPLHGNLKLKTGLIYALMYDGASWSALQLDKYYEKPSSYVFSLRDYGYIFIDDNGVLHFSGVFAERYDNGSNTHLTDGLHDWLEENSVQLASNNLLYCTASELGQSTLPAVIKQKSVGDVDFSEVFYDNIVPLLFGLLERMSPLGQLMENFNSRASNLVDILPIDSKFDNNSKVSSTNVGLWSVRYPETSEVIDNGDYKTVVIGARTTSSYPCIWLNSVINRYFGKYVTISFYLKGTSASGTLKINGNGISSEKEVNYTTSWRYVELEFTVLEATSNLLMFSNIDTENAISVDIKDLSIKVDKDIYRYVNYANTPHNKKRLNLIMSSLQTNSGQEPCEFNYNNEYGKAMWCTPKYIKNDNPLVILSSNEFFEVSVAYYDKNFQGIRTVNAVSSDANNEVWITLQNYPYFRLYFQKRINEVRQNFKPTIYIEGGGEEIYATIQNKDTLKFTYDDSKHNANFPEMEFANGYSESWGWLPLTIPVNITHANDTDNQDAVVQDSEEYVYDYGWLALPATYSNIGKPTRLIIWCHGSAMHYTKGNKTINTGRMGADPSYWLSEGYAVMDMEGSPFGYESGTTRYPHDGIPEAYECYKAGYEFVVNTFNICKDGVFVGGRSLGGGMAMSIIATGGIPVIAACLNAPTRVCEINFFKNRNAARRAYDAYYKGFSPTGNLETDATYWGGGNLNETKLSFITANKDKYLKYSQYTRLIENFPKWANYLALANKDTFNSESDREDVINAYADSVIRTKTPVKIFVSPSDITVDYHVGAELLYNMLSMGGSVSELRIFPPHDSESDPYQGEPANTGHPFDVYVGNRVAEFKNTRGIDLLNVPIAYIEALQFWRRYENNLS